MENNYHTTEINFLDNSEFELVQAGSGKRFANYIIDRILFVLIFFVGGFSFATIDESGFSWLTSNANGIMFEIFDRIISMILYGLYMFIVEILFKGKSLGKLITGTRAVHQDGTKLTLRSALLRGLSRMVPFEVFSALGSPCYPWHDRWTKTYVIDEKRSNYQPAV